MLKYITDGILYELGSGSSPDTKFVAMIFSELPASSTVGNKFLLFVSYIIYATLL
jgi:hypothetical protein